MIKLTWKPVPNSEVIILRRTGGIISDLFTDDDILTRLDDTVDEYVDLTAEINKVYYYRVDYVLDGHRIRGYPMCQMVTPTTGVGPNKLLRGDWSFGYFGEVPIEDFFSPEDLRSRFDLSTHIQPAPGLTLTVFHKYVLNGRIYLIPDGPVSHVNNAMKISEYYNGIYGRGMMYGTDTFGPNNTKPSFITSNSKVQDFRVEKDGHRYLVHLPSNVGVDQDQPGEFSVTGDNVKHWRNELGLLADTLGMSGTLPRGSLRLRTTTPRINNSSIYCPTASYLKASWLSARLYGGNLTNAISNTSSGNISTAYTYLLPIFRLDQ